MTPAVITDLATPQIRRRRIPGWLIKGYKPCQLPAALPGMSPTARRAFRSARVGRGRPSVLKSYRTADIACRVTVEL
jgi:hypothetical protein